MLNFISIGVIVVFSVALRFWRLDSIPVNLTGDETVYLVDIYQTIFSNKNHSLFSLIGDGAQPIINLYPMILSVAILGLNKSFLAIRLSTAIISVIAIIPFYFLIRRRTSGIIAITFTLLFSTSYWYLNFSRSSWINVNIILFGLTMTLLLEKGIEKKKAIWFIAAGVFSALCLYGYFSGKVYVLAALVYLATLIIKSPKKKILLINTFAFILTTSLIFLPQFMYIMRNKNQYLLRPKTVLFWKAQKPYYGYRNMPDITIFQVKESLRGLVLLSGKAIGKGVENQRYTPPGIPVVDSIIRILFLLGILFSFMKKWKIGFWWLTFCLTIIFVVIPTTDPPNTARAISVLPVIYSVAALTCHELSKLIIKLAPQAKVFAGIIFIFTAIGLAMFNLARYFNWASSAAVATARQPAVEKKDFQKWQKFQIKRIQSDQYPVNNYEWYKIKDDL